MKILIYGINFSPELTGIGKYSGEKAAWLAAQGHEIRVVTAPPYYPHWKVNVGYSTKTWSRERWQGVDVWRCPLWVPERPSGAKRLLHLASFAVSSLPVVVSQIFWRPDVVWVVEPPLFCAPTAWGLAKLCGAKSWLHIQDYEVDAAFDMGILKGALLQRMVKAGERWLMRRFDRVSTISGAMLARGSSKGVPPHRLKFVPNWVDLAGFVQAAEELAPLAARRADAYRKELSIPEDVVVALYSGNMGAKQGLEILPGVAKLCEPGGALANQAKQERGLEGTATAPKSVYFVFCGNGVGRDKLAASCKGMPHVRFMPLQPAERLPELLNMADIHLLPQRADAADLVMPSKLTGMLASGRPVVATARAGTEIANVVQGRGVVVPPEDPQAMAEAVLRLAADPGLRCKLGSSGRAYAELHLEKSAVLSRFEVELGDLVLNSGQGVGP